MSYQQLKKKTEGFTIIEVLIVLAIAGLIMLIVFMAVPQLQRSQRNNARTTDVTRISAAVTECLANRNGVTASCDELSDINVGSLNQVTTLGTSASTSQAVLAFNTVCTSDNSASTTTGASPRQFTLVYQKEPAVPLCVAS